MNVIKKIVDLCLNIEAKYVGRRTVTQQGAKRAATPAKKEAIKDALINNSILKISYSSQIFLRLLFELFLTIFRAKIIGLIFILKRLRFFVFFDFHQTNRVGCFIFRSGKKIKLH